MGVTMVAAGTAVVALQRNTLWWAVAVGIRLAELNNFSESLGDEFIATQIEQGGSQGCNSGIGGLLLYSALSSYQKDFNNADTNCTDRR